MSRTVIAGDIHLDYPAVETEKVREWVRGLLEDPPDAVILGGDVYELWRRDMAGVMWETDWFTSAMRELAEGGTNVEYVVGNHDGWFYTNTQEGHNYPFDVHVDYTFTSGGEYFFVTHGHKYEPMYNPIVNDALSVTNDYTGSLAHKLWANRPLPGNLIERAALFPLGPAASFLDPESTSKSRLRTEIINAGIEAESGDGAWGIYGHTHIPLVDEERKIANWGSWTAGRASYIEVVDGDVRFIDLFE